MTLVACAFTRLLTAPPAPDVGSNGKLPMPDDLIDAPSRRCYCVKPEISVRMNGRYGDRAECA